MEHHLNLNPDPFNAIKYGTKRIEMRLFDNKRELIKVGDTIIFTNEIGREKLSACVVSLNVFPSFKELYDFFDPIILGYQKGETVNYKDMERYYTPDNINKYGVIGIEIRLN